MKGRGIIGLGLVASGRRNIRDGSEFETLYAKHELLGTNPIVGGDFSDTYDTLNHMVRIVRETLNDTKKVAPTLIGSTLEETLRNNWNHVYKHFQYRKDANGIEQLRRPARAWTDRKSGIDCDCMSIILSSLMHWQKINHTFRKAQYNNENGWQHVYVVVPKKGVSIDAFYKYNDVPREMYYVLDCVVDKFNKEVPFLKKFDKVMKIQYLNGLDYTTLNGGVTSQLAYGYNPITSAELLAGFGCEFDGLHGFGDSLTPQEMQSLFIRGLKQHLVNTRSILAINPQLTVGLYEPALFIQRLDALIASFDNGTLGRTLRELADLEEREQQQGLSGPLGNIFKKIASGVKKVAQNIKTTAKVAVKKIAATVKKVAKFVVRYNPATIAVRNGLLLAMKINLFRLAEKLGYGYWTEAQAQQAGLNLNEWRKNRDVLAKVRNIHKKIGGKVEKFDNAVKKGWEHGVKKHNLPRLSSSSAALVVTPPVQVIKSSGLGNLVKQVSATIPLLQMVSEQLKDLQFKSLLRKDETSELAQFLQAVRMNKGGIATMLSLAYKPAGIANRYDTQEYSKLLTIARQAEESVRQRGGTPRQFREAVNGGKQVAITDSNLGEITTAAVTAAAGVLTAIGTALKEVNFKTMFKGKADSPQASDSEIKSSNVTAPVDEDTFDEGDPSVSADASSITSLISSFVPQGSKVSNIVKNLVSSPTASLVKSVVSSQVKNIVASMTPKQAKDLATKIRKSPQVAVLKETPLAKEIEKISNEPIQEANVIESRLPEEKNNTVMYVVIGTGVALALATAGYFIMRKSGKVRHLGDLDCPAPSPATEPVKEEALSGVKKVSKSKSSRRGRKAMAITI